MKNKMFLSIVCIKRKYIRLSSKKIHLHVPRLNDNNFRIYRDIGLTSGREELFKTSLIEILFSKSLPFLKRIHILCLKLSTFILVNYISTCILKLSFCIYEKCYKEFHSLNFWVFNEECMEIASVLYKALEVCLS